MRKKFQKFLAALSVFLIVVAGIGVVFLWLSLGPITGAKLKLLQFLPIPMATVEGKPIFAKDFLFRAEIAEKIIFSGQNSGKTSFKDNLLEKMIGEKKLSILADSYKLDASRQQINEEYTRIASGQPDVNESLGKFGLSQQNFKDLVIKPEILKTNIQIWHNSQKELNPGEFNMAENLLERARNGENFVSLAKSFSQDEATKPFGGDLGFADIQKFLPELQMELSSMRPGDVKLLPSRLGLHLFKLESKANGLSHLRQIFIAPENFSDWLAEQTRNMRVKMFLKLY